MTKKKRTRPTVRRGTYVSVSLDPMTRDRLRYAAIASERIFGIPASAATIIRAAVCAYVDRLDRESAQEPSGFLPTSDEEQAWMSRRHELLSANSGQDSAWKYFPGEELAVSPLPKFGDLVREHRRRNWRPVIETLPPPESFGPRWMHLVEAEEGDKS